MKDSGIPWVGMIPFDWKVLPAGGVFSEVKEKNHNNQYTNPFSFRYGEIVDKKIGDIDENLEETLSAYRVVSPNTIMLNGLNLNYDFITQRVAIVKKKGIITSAYLAVKPDETRVEPRFMLYLLKSYDFHQVLHSVGTGIRKTLKYQDFKNLKIIAPDRDTQQRLADYLDEECARIDAIITDAKVSIENYKQWKTAIISEAITTGIHSDICTRDSGCERIGAIPEHWTVRKMKTFVNDVSSGLSAITGDTAAEESGKYVLRTSSVSTGVFKPDEVKSVLTNALDRLICPVERDTLIMSRMNTASMVGYCAYVADDYPDCFLPDKLWKIHTKDTLMAKYAWFLINAPVSHDWFASVATGTSLSMLNISLSDFYNLIVAVPPIDEQKEICEFLDDRCSKIDACISEKQTLISDLESYKKSLIYEVVTGKRKVV